MLKIRKGLVRSSDIYRVFRLETFEVKKKLPTFINF
jgi:hypothetical protein